MLEWFLEVRKLANCVQSKSDKGFFGNLWDKISGGRAEVEDVCSGDDMAVG